MGARGQYGSGSIGARFLIRWRGIWRSTERIARESCGSEDRDWRWDDSDEEVVERRIKANRSSTESWSGEGDKPSSVRLDRSTAGMRTSQ